MTSQSRILNWNRVVGAALYVFALLLPAAVSGQGWIEPRPGPQPLPQWGIEKLRTVVTVTVADRIATVEVEEWFRNNGSGLGEGDYVYPLPGDAVFTSYSLYQGDREMRGEMMDANRAREIYEGIVRAQRDPALIELIGKGMVRARVFPIEAGQTRRITLRYTQVLEGAGDALHFRYAAGVRHAGVRRADVTPMPVSLNGGDVAPLTFTLHVENGARFRDAFSPTHRVRVDRERGRMTVRPRDEIAGDFAVFLPFAQRSVGLTLATHRPAGEDGYFMLTLSPGDVAEARVPRDLTVVVDVSGSMSGEKMEQARRAVQQLLGTLTPEDRVRLIAFSSRVSLWREGWTTATREDLRRAHAWAEDLRADGGTDIHGALELAFRAESPASRLPIVVFMTDGRATNGETRTERIVAMTESQRGRTRVFVFGVGYDVNTHLLDALSVAARGTTQYVRPNENVEEAVALLGMKIRHPVLTDLALERGPVRLKDVYPRVLPDLFAGEELVLFGRYEGAGQGRIGVTGRRGASTERYATQARFPERDRGSGYLPRLWASRKLGDLDRRIRSARADGASKEQVVVMIEELRETALRYGLLSEHTAYLVQEPATLAAQGADAVRSGGMFMAPAPVTTGQTAVLRAEEARRSREVSSVADMEAVQRLSAARLSSPEAPAAGAVSGAGTGLAANRDARTVAGRSFNLRNGVWEDVAHRRESRLISVEPYSAAYFALLRVLPELDPVLRELNPVLVAGSGASIRVAAGGQAVFSDAELRRIVTEFRGASQGGRAHR
ncbi:VIT domain-containing protein [soil metagenome]